MWCYKKDIFPVLPICYTIVILAWGFTLLSITAVLVSKMLNYNAAYSSLITNWSNDIIEDFEVAGSCSSGFSEFMYYTWPGTI